MALHWTIRSLPEFNHLTETERDALMRRHVGISFYFRLVRNSILFALVIAAFTGAAFGAFGTEPRAAWALAACAAPIAFIFNYQFAMRVIRNELRLTMLQGFAGRKLPVCLFCGYDLKGIEADCCPECGKGIVVTGKKSPKGIGDVKSESE